MPVSDSLKKKSHSQKRQTNSSKRSPLATHSTTNAIVESITRAIIERRLEPGERLIEQKIANQFSVSRTLVRQALNQLSQKNLVVIALAKGACVAAPSLQEANEVFALRSMLETAMMTPLIDVMTPAKLKIMRLHLKNEAAAIERHDLDQRVELLGDFHVVLAELSGNAVLAQTLKDLISRCSLITLLYQSEYAATHSHREHLELAQAIENKDKTLAAQLMREHLAHVMSTIDLKE